MTAKERILCAGLALTATAAGMIALITRGKEAAVAVTFLCVCFGLLILADDMDWTDRGGYAG